MFTEYHRLSLCSDTVFQGACRLGAGWILGGMLESGEGVLQKLFAGKRGGLDKSLILQRKEKR